MEWWQLGGAVGLAGGIGTVMVMIGKQVFGLTTKQMYKKAFDTDYVTVVMCEANRKECRGNADSKALRQAVSLLIEYNDKIPLEKRVEIRNGLIT